MPGRTYKFSVCAEGGRRRGDTKAETGTEVRGYKKSAEDR